MGLTKEDSRHELATRAMFRHSRTAHHRLGHLGLSSHRLERLARRHRHGGYRSIVGHTLVSTSDLLGSISTRLGLGGPGRVLVHSRVTIGHGACRGGELSRERGRFNHVPYGFTIHVPFVFTWIEGTTSALDLVASVAIALYPFYPHGTSLNPYIFCFTLRVPQQ